MLTLHCVGARRNIAWKWIGRKHCLSCKPHKAAPNEVNHEKNTAIKHLRTNPSTSKPQPMTGLHATLHTKVRRCACSGKLMTHPWPATINLQQWRHTRSWVPNCDHLRKMKTHLHTLDSHLTSMVCVTQNRTHIKSSCTNCVNQMMRTGRIQQW